MEASPISPDMGAAPGSVAEAGLKSVRLAAQPEGGDVAAKAPGGGKMHRAGRKAAVMSILEKNLGRRDPLKKGDLERVVAFLHSDPGARTQAEIARCLVMLKNFQFLEPYSDEQRRQLAGIAIYTRFSRGQVLFNQEDKPDALYIVVAGKVSLHKTQGEMHKLIASCGAGDACGDLQHLDEKGRRSVTASASSHEAEVMVLPRVGLDALAVRWRDKEEREKLEFLVGQVPVFNKAAPALLEDLTPCFERVKVAKDTVLYRPQDEASSIFFVWEGEVQLLKRLDLVKTRASAGDGASPRRAQKAGGGSRGAGATAELGGVQARKISKSVPMAVVGPGDFFGEVEVFNDTVRCSAAIAQTDCVFLVLARQHLMEAIPQVVLESIFRYSTMRVQWRNSRLLLLLESLANLHWAPERDARAALEPEIKALMKMRTSLLPDLMDSPAWLGAHTNLSADDSHDAREWHLYYYGPWATLAEGGDVRGKGDGDVLKRQSSGDRDVATAESRDRSRSRPASEERGQEGARQSGGGGDGEEAGGAPGSRASTAGGGSAGGGSAGSREGPQRGGTSAGREGDGSAMGRQPGPGSAQGQGGVSFFSPPHAKSGALFG